MPDLDLRFDEITERYHDRPLRAIRELANSGRLPSGPISLEIGSNRGRLLRELAARHPDRFYIGIEIRAKWAAEANESLQEEGIDNALVVRADALWTIPVLIDDGQLREVFVFYPDPWWKARHRRRRVIREEMLDLLSPKMADGAPMWVRTDVGPLANDMRAVLNAHSDFTPMPLERYPLVPLPHSERDVVTIANELPVHTLYYERGAVTHEPSSDA